MEMLLVLFKPEKKIKAALKPTLCFFVNIFAILY